MIASYVTKDIVQGENLRSRGECSYPKRVGILNENPSEIIADALHEYLANPVVLP